MREKQTLQRAATRACREEGLLAAMSVFLLATLLADAGVARDAGIPLWAPKIKRADLEDSSATYGLRRWEEGYLWDGGTFEARVARDGIVTFKDKHMAKRATSHFPLNLLPIQRESRPTPGLVVKPKDPATLRYGPWLEPPRPSPFVERNYASDCPPGVLCNLPPMIPYVQVWGSFDLTDEIMRGLGQDPYALQKARFLSATFEFRIKLAIEARKADLLQALDRLPERLTEVWGDGRYTARERRRILYELWQESDLASDGERAAQIIEQWIRKHLPCGHPDTYTNGELAAFANAHPQRRFPPSEECQLGNP